MTDHDSNDEVATLVRQAGKRPPVTGDALARLRAATYEGWQAKVGRRQVRRRGALYAGLAAAVIVVIAITAWYRAELGGPGTTNASVARVEAVVGTVSIQLLGGEAVRGVLPGQEIAVGTRLTTLEGKIALRWPGGPSVRVDAFSGLHVIASGRIRLDAGAVYVDSGTGSPAAPLAIVTPAGEVRDVGTQFETRWQGSSLCVRVREGAVSITRDRTVHEVSAGGALEISEEGRIMRSEAPAYGPAWAWIDGVAPMPDVHGRPLREFIEWAARERGFTVTFVGAGTEERAAAISVDGSIEGLTLDQALETVFEACGLGYRVDAGVFLVLDDEAEERR